jgi:alpha-ketoglutarate-dependent taurine dioxygenase
MGVGWYVIPWEDPLINLARALGTPIPARRSGPLTQLLLPTEAKDALPFSLSAGFGVGSFPWHTDGAHWRHPPRWVVMRLASGGASQTATGLVSLAELGLNEQQRLLLRGAMFVISRGRSAFLRPLLDDITYPGRLVLRLDPRVMRPAHDSSLAAYEMLQRALDATQPARVEWRQGHALVVDNWNCAHMREAVRTEERRNRVLERVLVRAE